MEICTQINYEEGSWGFVVMEKCVISMRITENPFTIQRFSEPRMSFWSEIERKPCWVTRLSFPARPEWKLFLKILSAQTPQSAIYRRLSSDSRQLHHPSVFPFTSKVSFNITVRKISLSRFQFRAQDVSEGSAFDVSWPKVTNKEDWQNRSTSKHWTSLVHS